MKQHEALATPGGVEERIWVFFFLTETNKWLVEYNDGQNRANETLFHLQQIVDKITGNPI